MVMRDFATTFKRVNQVLPVSGTATQGGNYNFVSLRNYQGAALILDVGIHTGDPASLTVRQAKNVEGNGSKAMTSHVLGYKNVPGASPQEESDRWDSFVITSGTFVIAAATRYIIPIRPAMLDVTNDFDCIRMQIAGISATTVLSMAMDLWGGPQGIPTNVDHIPSANVNRMPN